MQKKKVIYVKLCLFKYVIALSVEDMDEWLMVCYWSQ